MNKNIATPGELIPVSDFMTTNVVVANENQSVRYVCKLRHEFLVDIPISEIMSKPLITIRKVTSINDAISIMQAKNIRRLPIVENTGKMIGIITDKDILKAIMTNQSLATSLLADPTLLVDQHSLFGRYTSSSWFRDICPTQL
ncbi:MAG: CBS domain-containing protein [Nitrososphaeraceae archaeon]